MTTTWDLVVVGAGTAGIPAAIAAVEHGGRVLLLDAAEVWGGTLHVATGWLSAAGTRVQREQGILDSPDDHFDDVMRISKGSADQTLVRLAVDNAAPAFDWLMDNGFNLLPGHPVQGEKHGGYRVPRYYCGSNKAHSILAVLDRKLRESIASGRLEIKLSTEVTSLLTEPEPGSDAAETPLQRVVGVVAIDKTQPGSAPQTYRSRAVVLSTGGYNADPEKFAEFSGRTLYSAESYPYARGVGLTLGTSVGGWTRGQENFLCSFGSVLEHDDYPSPVYCQPEHRPEHRLPWEIYVN